MSPQEKLLHLKDYMDLWVDFKFSEKAKIDWFFQLFVNCGVIIHENNRLLSQRLLTFDQFIQSLNKEG